MNNILWTSNGCFYGVLLKRILKKFNVSFEERVIGGQEWSMDDFKKSVPGAKTLPQYIHGGDLVGGYSQVAKYYNNKRD
jgi:glutaredoxin